VTAYSPMAPGRRLVVTIGVMVATMMQVLDTTIANVALPHMQATLSATMEQVAWVLTSYILASAVMTPLTGWLDDRLGRRALFTICAGGFTIASALCGAAPTLTAMVAARVLQGLFGALLMPLSQAVLLDIYPVEKRAKAITLWSMTTMIGPIMGPILGGWITQNFTWRWVFYVNIPFGVFSTAVLWWLLPTGRAASRRFDLFGFALLATALASLQLLLDRGTQKDWFDSTEILIETGLAVSALWMFVVHTITAPAPLLPRALFRDRNFIIANGLTLIIFGVTYSSQALMAPMLQQLLHYDTTQAGTLMAPRGLGVLVSIIVSGRLSGLVDNRIQIAFGLLCLIAGQSMASDFTIMMEGKTVALAGFVAGLGNGFVMMPLTMIVFLSLGPTLRTDASALVGLVRNLAGSIAIAVGGAMAAHSVQVAHAEIGEHVTAQSMPMLDPRLVEQAGHAGGMAAALVDAEVNRQALMIAYINDFRLMMWVAILILPLVVIIRPVRARGAAPTPIME
jgi:DHA2 family multidrug resistance protein